MTDEVATAGWARVWATIRPPQSRNLRAGAWYQVVKADRADRVTLNVYGRMVDVPRRILEIRPDRPDRFSVVHRVGYRPPSPQRRSLHKLGRYYGVCPRCSWRFALYARPERARCPECGHDGEVAWWEAD